MSANVEVEPNQNAILVVTIDKDYEKYVTTTLQNNGYSVQYTNRETTFDTMVAMMPKLVIFDADLEIAPDPTSVLLTICSNEQTRYIPMLILYTFYQTNDGRSSLSILDSLREQAGPYWAVMYRQTWDVGIIHMFELIFKYLPTTPS